MSIVDVATFIRPTPRETARRGNSSRCGRSLGGGTTGNRLIHCLCACRRRNRRRDLRARCCRRSRCCHRRRRYRRGRCYRRRRWLRGRTLTTDWIRTSARSLVHIQSVRATTELGRIAAAWHITARKPIWSRAASAREGIGADFAICQQCSRIVKSKWVRTALICIFYSSVLLVILPTYSGASSHRVGACTSGYRVSVCKSAGSPVPGAVSVEQNRCNCIS